MRNYTEKQLKENYDKFISFVKKAFASQPERLEKLLHMYSEDQLGMELLMAPASGKAHFHSAYVGGYIDHIMNVCKNSIGMMKQFKENGGIIDFEVEELLFAALHHDLGKLGDLGKPYYIEQESEWHRKNQGSLYKQNPDINYMDVTHRALWTLQQYGIQFTQKEMLGIMLADGLYNKANEKYFISYDENFQLKTELPYLLHWADHMSCRIENSEYKNGLKNF
jgi:hypothetical protein